jgi:Domain of unknown function (DUF4276)
VRSTIYLEGGGDSRDLQTRCQKGFRKLLEQCGFVGRMPKLVACGGRNAAFDNFKTALTNARKGDFVALWIDSEDPMADIEDAWGHLKSRDDWNKPENATNDQVLLMTTCMETWIVADRATLADHYGTHLQESALPPLQNLEARSRHAIQDALTRATRNCSNKYTKGKRSFEVLGLLDPATLSQYLPSFVRVRRILDASL